MTGLLALAGGLRGIVVALAASAATVALLAAYDRLIDDPAVARAAKAGMVAIAKVEAAEAERDAQLEIAAAFRRLASDRQRIAAQETAARQDFEIKALAAETINAELKDDLDAILSTPVAGACDLHGVFNRLRNP